MQNIKTKFFRIFVTYSQIWFVSNITQLQYLFPYVCFAYNSLLVSQGYIMVVYFDSIALFQQFLENFLIWSRFSTVKSTRIVYFMVSFLFALGFLYFSYFIQLTSKKAHCLLPQYILKISQVNINVTYGQGKLVRG